MNYLRSNTQVPFIYLGFPYNADYVNNMLIRQAQQKEQYLKILYYLRKHHAQSQCQIYQQKHQLGQMLELLKPEAASILKIIPSYSNHSFSATYNTPGIFSMDFQAGPGNGMIYGNNPNLQDFNTTDIIPCKVESEESASTDILPQKTPNLEELKSIKNHIYEMLEFFIESFGKTSPNEIEKQRTKYSHNIYLVQIFDLLQQKYLETAKCREDMIRLLIRKALTFMRNTLVQELNLNTKQASVALCKKYFLQTSNLEMEKMEDKILDFFLPYKKHSRNKTPNARFIEEAFLSKDFLQAYMTYLSKFDEIMKIDNQKKIKKFTDFIYDCVTKQKIQKIKEYKRLPWLNSWVETMKIIAHELLDRNLVKNSMKKERLEEKERH